jgi:subtilase family serine protease
MLSGNGAMRLSSLLIASVLGAALAAGSTTGQVSSPAPPAPTAATAGASPVSGVVHPMIAEDRFLSSGAPPTMAACEKKYGVVCYGVHQMTAAYNLAPLFTKHIDGRGQTIVIVDSFGSPTIRQDLATFDKAFGLPAPPSLKMIQPAGKVLTTNAGWAAEATLDVEWSHAMAPRASILLVETPVSETEGTTGFPQIVKAENYVIAHHLGGVISQSFGATERTFASSPSRGRAILAPLRTDYVAAAKAGISVLASSGDTGAAGVQMNGTSFFTTRQVSWPASDPLVTAVGGTRLRLDNTGHRTAPDTTWNDTYVRVVQQLFTGSNGPSPLSTGGGVSAFFNAPSYQSRLKALDGGRRAIPDVAMSAACSGAVDVYQSFPGSVHGWSIVCGTSEASPMFAGIVALADQMAGHPLGLLNPKLYALQASHSRGLVDVTRGDNTVTFFQGHKITVTGYSARLGYDLVTGVGTVNAAKLVPALAGR